MRGIIRLNQDRKGDTEEQLEMFPSSNLYATAVKHDDYGDTVYSDAFQGSGIFLVELKNLKGELKQTKKAKTFYQEYIDSDGDLCRDEDVFIEIAEVKMDQLWAASREHPDLSMEDWLDLIYMQGKMKLKV